MSSRQKLSAVVSLTLLFLFGVLPIASTSIPAHAATRTVFSKANAGAGTLRKAIADANSGDTIKFSITGTITLTTGQLEINKNLTLTGPGANRLTLSGNNTSRVLFVNSGDVTITGLTVAAGSGVFAAGGGIVNLGTLTIRDSILSANHVVGKFAEGGGIYNAGTLTITNSTLSGNSAGEKGGGIYNDGTAAISNSTLSGNHTETDEFGIAGQGGGIYNGSGTLDVSNSTLSGNDSGGIVNAFGALTISNSTLSGNSGGGIVNSFGGLNISNSTLSGNTANSGGGILNGGGAFAAISYCTLTGNGAEADEFGFGGLGGGLYNEGTVTLGNSILAGNMALYGPDVYNGGSFGGTITSQGYNLIGIAGVADITATNDDQLGTSDAPIDALLDPLADNGGPTQTHALKPGSPAIDKGDGTLGTDQRGIERPQDDPNTENPESGDGSDIGAFEAEQSPLGGGVELTVSPIFSGNTTTLVYRLKNNSHGELTNIVVMGNIGDFFGNNYTLKPGAGKAVVKVLNPRTRERRVTWNNFRLRAGDDAQLTFTVKLPPGSAGKVIAWNWTATFKTIGDGVLTKTPDIVRVP